MTLQPATTAELAGLLGAASAAGNRVSGFDLRALNRVVEFAPEDMTVTVEAGITLAALQAQLASRGQWLPIDPSHGDRLSIGALLSTNRSGPRRYGYGTIRDWLIGIRVALADGRVIKSGGKVVKNVAGYDLGKIFVGSHGSLGVIVEASFKLRPLPEAERFVQASCASVNDAARLIDAVAGSEMTPVVFDLHCLEPSGPSRPQTLVLGFAGSREEVGWQVDHARLLGLTGEGSLDHETVFWNDSEKPRRISVLPSALLETISRLDDASFVARAGNGVLYHRNGSLSASCVPRNGLPQRLRDEFDPRHILPDPPL